MWYFFKKGQPEGPVSADEIKARIKKGLLGPYDLVYRESEDKWLAIQDLDDFKSTLSFNNNVFQEKWVVLIKKNGSKTRAQIGPFTTQELRHKIKSEEIKLSDYVWREGMKEWYKIAAIETLHSRNKNQSFRFKNEQEEERDLFKNVELLKREDFPSQDIPSEAEGPDLVENKEKIKEKTVERLLKHSLVKEKKSKRAKKRDISEVSQVTSVRQLSWRAYVPSIEILRAWVAPVGGLLLGICLFSLGVYFIKSGNLPQFIAKSEPNVESHMEPVKSAPELSKAKPAQTKTPSVRAPVETSAPSAASRPAAAPPAAPPPPARLQEARKAPSRLSLRLQNSGSEAPKILVQTDASSHFDVRARLESDIGRVIGRNSYIRTWSIKGLEDRTVDLSQITLSPGHYRFYAELEGFSESISLSVATRGNQFESQFNAHRKKISQFTQEERYGLFRQLSQIENLFGEFESAVRRAEGWRGFYSGWRQRFGRTSSGILRQITQGNHRDYILAPYWLRLKSLRSEVDALSQALNRAGGKPSSDQTAAISRLKRDLAALKNETLDISLF
jgi:hypothetical protein